jgi:cell division protein FtsQ
LDWGFDLGFYRGTKVPLKGGGVRLYLDVRDQKSDARKERNFLFPWIKSRDQKESRRRRLKKVDGFYRPGVTTQVGRFHCQEDRPSTETSSRIFSRARSLGNSQAFGEKNRARIFKKPAGRGARWAFRLGGLALLLTVLFWSKERTTAVLQDIAGIRLEKVNVEGNRFLSEEEVVKAAALPAGENMFRLDLEKAGENIKALSWVERVFIERRLPRSVLVSIKERQPVALLDNGLLFGLDVQGRVLPASNELMREDLPLVSGVSFPVESVGTTLAAQAVRPALDFLDFLKKQDAAMAQDVSEINLSEADSLKVTFIDGVQVLFTPPVSETELKRMALVLADLNQKGKRAGTVDFRYRDIALVKTR